MGAADLDVTVSHITFNRVRIDNGGCGRSANVFRRRRHPTPRAAEDDRDERLHRESEFHWSRGSYVGERLETCGTGGKIVWRVYDDGGTFREEMDLTDNGTDWHEVSVSITGVLVLEMELIGEVGSWPAEVQFEVLDSSGAAIAVIWVFNSGVESKVQRAFEVQRAIFLGTL